MKKNNLLNNKITTNLKRTHLLVNKYLDHIKTLSGYINVLNHLIKDRLVTLNIFFVKFPYLAPLLFSFMALLCHVSLASCDSSNWDQQWIQGAPLDKQPQWFRDNTQDPRSLYEQMNGPEWRNISDHYDLENNDPTYKPYGWDHDTSSTSTSDDNDNASSDTNSISDYPNDIDVLSSQHKLEELNTYFNDIFSLFYQQGGFFAKRELLHSIIESSDNSVWIPENLEEFKNGASSYNIAQQHIVDIHITLLKEREYEYAEFYTRMGTCMFYEAHAHLSLFNEEDDFSYDAFEKRYFDKYFNSNP